MCPNDLEMNTTYDVEEHVLLSKSWPGGWWTDVSTWDTTKDPTFTLTTFWVLQNYVEFNSKASLLTRATLDSTVHECRVVRCPSINS